MTWFYENSDTATSVNRVIIFRGKYENDVVPVIGDLLEYTSTSILACTSPKTYDKRFKTKILYDKTFTLSPLGVDKSNIQFMSGVLKLNGHVNYDVSQTDGTDIEDGGIYMYVVSTHNTLTKQTGNFRITYTDN